jgi:hypothetical protein
LPSLKICPSYTAGDSLQQKTTFYCKSLQNVHNYRLNESDMTAEAVFFKIHLCEGRVQADIRAANALLPMFIDI